MAIRALILALFGVAAVVRLLAAPAVTVTGKEKTDLNGLVTNSPFGSPKSGNAAANNGNEPFEFRAVLEEKFFSIYDTNTHRSSWVELNDPVNGFSVKNYDAAKESITVDYQGKPMTLAIKRAPAAVQVFQPPQQPLPQPGTNGVVQQPMPGQQPGQVATAGPSAVDQQRIQQIQEEIRRRRALRSQAVSPNGNAGPQPNFRGEGQPPGSVGPVVQPSTSAGPQPYPQRN